MSQEQKEFHAEVAQELLETANKDPYFPKKVMTRDKSWVFGYDCETKAQSSQWELPESPHPKMVLQSRNNVKGMLKVFFF